MKIFFLRGCYKNQFKNLNLNLSTLLNIYNKYNRVRIKKLTQYKRNKCPQCGNENPRKLHEEPDKNNVLYYSIGKVISAYR